MANRAAALHRAWFAPHRRLRKGLPLVALVCTACVTRMLDMPTPRTVPSPAGPTIEVAPVVDGRAASILGKVDTITVDSGPDLLDYVEGELANSLSTLGFAVRGVERGAPATGRKRLLATLRSAELASESTAYFPVAASVSVEIEVVDESGTSTFRKEVRGASSRDLGFHRQGGPEDAQLLAESVDQAIATLSVDASFAVALAGPMKENARQRGSDGRAMEATRKSERAASEPGVADRLRTLDRLRDEGLIDRSDYERKRQEILDGL